MIKVQMKDALRAEQLTPGWRKGVVVNHFEKTAATDGSKLDVFNIEVEEGGRMYPLKDYQISEKAVSMGKNFFIACGLPKEAWDALVKGESEGLEIDPRNCIGKELQVFVSNSTFAGRVSNEATDFMPPKKDA